MKMLIKPALAAVLATAAVLPAAAYAQAAAQILIVDGDQILATSEAGKSGQAQLKTMIDQVNARANTLGTQFRTEEEALRKQQTTMAPAAFEAKAKDFQARYGTAQNELRGRQENLQRSQAYVVQQINTAALPIIQQVMRTKGASMVVQRGAVLAYTPALDITGEVVAQLNKSLPRVNATPPAAPAAPAK